MNFPDWLGVTPETGPLILGEEGPRRVIGRDPFLNARPQPDFSLTVVSPGGWSRTTYFDRTGMPIGTDESSPYVGSPIGYRTATTQHFDGNRRRIGVSQVTVHATGYPQTLHFDALGRLTGYTIEDWLGRRSEYDASGKLLSSTTELAPLAKQYQTHPQLLVSDGIDGVPDPNHQSAQAVGIDFRDAGVWVGVSVATLFPLGNVKLQHYARSNERTGRTDVEAAVPLSRGYFRQQAWHYDPRGNDSGRSEITRDALGNRQALSYDARGRWTARSVTGQAGDSFRYDPAGKLIGSSH